MADAFDQVALEEFVDVLEKLKIPYAIGGSVASSFYGQVRFTQDADVSVAAFGSQIGMFCKAIEGDFYVSSQAVKQAHANASSFNVIHLNTAFKIDVFIILDDPFKRQVLMRRTKAALDENSARMYNFVSPEDIILLKLQWYLEGGSVSQKQWGDILGVLDAQKDALDMDYMRDWALKLSISNLLNKALQQIKE